MYFQYNGTKPCTLVHGGRQPLTFKSMKLKLLRKYDLNEFGIDKLKLYGLKSVRSARRVPIKLSVELQK